MGTVYDISFWRAHIPWRSHISWRGVQPDGAVATSGVTIRLSSKISTTAGLRGVPLGVVHVGDVGTEIVLDCENTVSNATVRTIKVRKPNGVKTSWNAVSDGTTAIKYMTISGDLDVIGVWRFQAYIEMPGWKGHGAIAKVIVERLI